MPAYRTVRVAEILSERDGLQRVRLADGGRAYVLTQLVGGVSAGDDVVVNTTAIDLGLGTGGWHVVHWNLARRSWSERGPGHIMKLRYTSLQVDTGAAEEVLPGVAGMPDVDGLPSLGGVPVVVCSLHSQMGVVAATVADRRPGTRVGYLMTDGAALPLALSDLVHALRQRGLLHLTVTAGHAFGGDLEAVGVADGLVLAAQRCDLVVAAMGPGVVGTGSLLGTTAIEVATIHDLAVRLRGRPVVAVRASDADPRPRHRGVSHHTLTALRLCHGTPVVALPDGEDGRVLVEQLVGVPHEARHVSVPDPVQLLERAGLAITTMGRGPRVDPLAFAASVAAGVLAADLVG